MSFITLGPGCETKETKDIRGLVVDVLIDHLVCFVMCMVHHTCGDALVSVI